MEDHIRQMLYNINMFIQQHKTDNMDILCTYVIYPELSDIIQIIDQETTMMADKKQELYTLIRELYERLEKQPNQSKEFVGFDAECTKFVEYISYTNVPIVLYGPRKTGKTLFGEHIVPTLLSNTLSKKFEMVILDGNIPTSIEMFFSVQLRHNICLFIDNVDKYTDYNTEQFRTVL